MAYIYDYTPQIEAVQKQIDNYGQFRYGKENAYQKALAAVTNPTAFSYDVEQDPVYSAYRKQYLREGDRAMADTLAKASAATGGRPSSYAVTAAQQAGNYYNSQLTDVIPTLYQNAYQRYMNNIDLQKQALDVLAADRDAAKNEHQANYELLLEKLEELQALQEEPLAAPGSPVLGNFVAPGVYVDANTGKPAATPGGTFTPVSTTPHTLSTENNSTSSTDANPEPVPDLASIEALGFGPISAKDLNELVSKGIVIEYEENGKLKYRRGAKYGGLPYSKGLMPFR